jgi:hypothetical protein
MSKKLEKKKCFLSTVNIHLAIKQHTAEVKYQIKPGMVVNAYNSSIWKAEAGLS